MFYQINCDITVGRYKLQTLASVDVQKSVETLSDTCVITLSGSFMNQPIRVEDTLQEGDSVTVRFGYAPLMVTEFRGFLNRITTDDGTIRLECEDSLYLFRKALKNQEFKNITLKNLLNSLISEVNEANLAEGVFADFSLKSDIDFTWGSFTIFKATAYDVLKKVQEETKANIFFKDDILYVQPQYAYIVNDKPLLYDFSKNIEKSSLKYVYLKDKKIEVEVTTTAPDGTKKSFKYGQPGGDKKSIELGSVSDASAKTRAEQEFTLFSYDGYEGTFTAWLRPYCEPGYKVRLIDNDYPEKTGNYYVVAVQTKIGESGGERTITLGKQI